MAKPMVKFSPLCKPSEVRALAARYLEKDPAVDEEVLAIGADARRRRWFTKAELAAVCRWKSPRSAAHCARNDEAFVRATTTVALSTRSERLRIAVLTLLDGVQWPTASVLLHLGAADPTKSPAKCYPILDFRALHSLGVASPPPYNFDFWWQYTRFCREKAEEWGVDMRTLDRALWQKYDEPSI